MSDFPCVPMWVVVISPSLEPQEAEEVAEGTYMFPILGGSPFFSLVATISEHYDSSCFYSARISSSFRRT